MTMNEYHKVEDDYWHDEFSHHFTCWANNHNGWAKMKKCERKRAKQKIKKEIKEEIEQEIVQNNHS